MLPFRFGYNSSSSTRRLNNGPSAPLSVHRLWLQNPKAHQLVTKKDIDVSDHRFIRALDLRASPAESRTRSSSSSRSGRRRPRIEAH